MKSKNFSRIVAVVLTAVMLIGVLPMAAFASIANWATNNVVFSGTSFGTNGYYNVISKKDYVLVPGAATETEMVLNNSNGNRRQVMHIIEVDPSNPDISIVPGYYGIDKDLTDVNNQKAAGVTETVAYYENNLGYNVVGAMNTSLAYDCNAPIDFLVYNGVNLSIGAHHAQTFLAVIKDPDTGAISCELHAYGDGIPANCWQAVSANFSFTVRDGVLVTKTEERTSSTAARSMIGIKEDGTLVLVMNDGRGANNSIGFNTYELGESMLALGCKWAVNCDGGGSSSFLTKRAGESVNTMRCVPCDGAERPTLNSVMIVSNVGPTGVLNNVDITGDYDYFAPGTSYTFGADAIDTHGYAMDIPADATWSLSDASFGTIAGGAFVSNGTIGDVDVQVESGGEVVGSRTIHIANPETLTLSSQSTTLPYSTAAKPRSTTLPIVALVGEAPVYLDGNCLSISVAVPGAGTVDGLVFTATDDTTIPSTTVDITYLPTNQLLSYLVNFGQGSDILWDFEDGDISNWYGGSNDVKVWLTENGVTEENQLKTLISGGQISFSEQSHTFLSTRENGGQVHNGNNALGVEFDFRNVEFNSWVYALLYNIQDQYVLRDVANGKKATALGMWCYVPEGFCNPAGDTSGALAMQLTVYKNPQGTSGGQLNFQFYSEHQNKRVSLNQCTEADIPENRWVYLTADLTVSDYISLTNPLGTTYREPSFFRMYIKPTRAQTLTYYFDDFTLDYSSAVDDRDAPVISNPTYCVYDENVAFEGQTVYSNTFSFDANIADYAASNAEGLDYSSAAIYADGVALSGVTASGATMGVKNVVLSDGTHSIKFEIYDNAGNFSSVTKQITVEADPTKAVVTLAGHNDLGNVPESASVYYADIVASDIAQIDSATAVLKLNTANDWELDHIITPDGFTADYDYNPISKLATVTVTRTGDCALTGEQILASVPARVWAFDESTDVGGDGTASVHMTTAERFNSSYGEPKVFVNVDVVSGAIGYADGTTGTFGGSISVATKLTGNKANGMWHEHNAQPIEDKPATCIEDGFTGRTYCDECGSVVDWGTTIPATGHDYELINGQFVCKECEEVFKLGTGLHQVNGEIYYSIGGELVKGWQNVNEEWYYFDTSFAGVNGNYKYGSNTYTFENGKLVHGLWVSDENGTRYFYGPDYYRCTGANQYANVKWVTIDGSTYAFDRNGYIHTGLAIINESNNPGELYEFTDQGVLIGKYNTDITGVFALSNGKLCYLENGTPVAKGLFMYNGYYYYINGSYETVTGTYHCTNHMTNEIPAGDYEFDANGRMINVPGMKNGIYEENGNKYYYENNVRIKKGLVEVEEGVYYYFSMSYKALKDGTYYLPEEMMNNLLPAGTYLFDDYKLIIKNGVYEENGNKYYYENNEKVKKGLVEVEEGVYNYFGLNYKALKDGTYYLPEEKMNDLLPEGTYLFDGYDLVIKNGVYEENGNKYYYENNEKVKKGLVEVEEGVYNYFSMSYKALKDGTYYLPEEMMNNLLPAGTYLFDGYKLVIRNGVYEENGNKYYYENNEKVKKGLVEVEDGVYYYFSMSYKALKNGTYYLPEEMMNGILPAGNYTIDDSCKLIIKNGVYEENGNLYYYENNEKVKKGLVEVEDGVYYYFSYSYKALKEGSYYLPEEMMNGIYPAGTYTFDNYRFVIKDGFVHEKGGIYYYKDCVLQKDLGIIVVDDNYYYVKANGSLATGNYRIDYGTNGYLRGGNHTFDENGVLQVDPSFVIGVRGARDIAYLNQTSDVKIKEGLLIRGTELDRAVWDIVTEEQATYGVNKLKNEYGINMDMDLRLQTATSKDAFGESVLHKYYDMVYYDEVFTEDGKAKVKEVFTDLANLDNYPIYLHCTYGLDRTGTVCYLLEALLGFNDWNLSHDYCSTLNSHEASILKIKTGLANFDGETRQEQVTSYLLSCGLTQEQLNTICEIFLAD